MVVLSPFSCVRFFVTLWTVARQAPLPMGFSRQEWVAWSVFPCPPPGDLANPGIEPASPASPAFQADSLQLSHQGNPSKSLPECQINKTTTSDRLHLTCLSESQEN